jgi:hypothetical protein
MSWAGHWLAMRTNVCVSHASGSTSFLFAVCNKVAIVAHVLPPPSLPANRLFFRVKLDQLRKDKPKREARPRKGFAVHLERIEEVIEPEIPEEKLDTNVPM